MRTKRLLISTLLLLALPAALTAQVLARPGWKGSGLNADPWWKHAIFYNVAAPETVDFKALTIRLDALKSLDVDALILPAPALPAPGSNGAMTDLEDFDELLRAASRHAIRVVLTIQAPSSDADLSGLARFWLNRGVAGLHIASPAGASAQETQALVQSVRKQAAAALGQRIILSDVDLAPPAAAAPSREPARHPVRSSNLPAAELQIDTGAASLPTLDAASLRPLLIEAAAKRDLLLDLRPAAPGSPVSFPLAAIALAGSGAALIDSRANLVLEVNEEKPAAVEEPAKPVAQPLPSQPPPGVYLPYVPYVRPEKPKPAATPAPTPKPQDPLTNWYRQLAALHHDDTTLRTGTDLVSDFDSQNALVWVVRPPSPSLITPPVVVVCNLSASPLELSLTQAMKSLNLRGTFLRTLLRTESAMGGQDLDAVKVPAFGVYIGELRR